jgi:hypothetical protein
MADETATRRVELIDASDRVRPGLPGYIGVGLLGGFALGFGPLRDAAQGNGPFEDAMVRFVACLLVCVVSASVIGRLLDSAPAAGGDEGEDGASGREGAADDEPTTAPTDLDG